MDNPIKILTTFVLYIFTTVIVPLIFLMYAYLIRLKFDQHLGFFFIQYIISNLNIEIYIFPHHNSFNTSILFTSTDVHCHCSYSVHTIVM